MRTDWTPILHEAVITDGEPDSPDPLAAWDTDLAHANYGAYPNGKSEPVSYVWRPGDAEREAWVRARIVAARASILLRAGDLAPWDGGG